MDFIKIDAADIGQNEDVTYTWKLAKTKSASNKKTIIYHGEPTCKNGGIILKLNLTQAHALTQTNKRLIVLIWNGGEMLDLDLHETDLLMATSGFPLRILKMIDENFSCIHYPLIWVNVNTINAENWTKSTEEQTI